MYISPQLPRPREKTLEERQHERYGQIEPVPPSNTPPASVPVSSAVQAFHPPVITSNQLPADAASGVSGYVSFRRTITKSLMTIAV
jgi:hypothetical protein